MEKRKVVLFPVLGCIFILIFYMFETDTDRVFYFQIVRSKLNVFYGDLYRYTNRNGTNGEVTNGTTVKNTTSIHTNDKLIYTGTVSDTISSVRTSATTTLSSPITSSSVRTTTTLLSLIKSSSVQQNTTSVPSTITSIRTSATTTLSSPITSSSVQQNTTLVPSTITSIRTSSSLIKLLSSVQPNIISQNNTKQDSFYLCSIFMGGLGNQLFQFASIFGIAKLKNMRVIVGSDSEINRAFKLTVEVRQDMSACHTFKPLTEVKNCAYDPNLENFNVTESLRLGPYLQSWKYFYNFSNDLRKELTFRDEIQAEVYQVISSVVKKFNYTSRRDVTLIGLHVRRGDMVGHPFGYDVATPAYINTSVQYFLSRYKNPIFIISSQDNQWTKEHMPNNTLVEYINHPNRDVIVAILSSCDHTITTVGSFGWWIGWLAGGEVTYYKWPAKEGSGLRNQYSIDYSDYFYPGWIGF